MATIIDYGYDNKLARIIGREVLVPQLCCGGILVVSLAKKRAQ